MPLWAAPACLQCLGLGPWCVPACVQSRDAPIRSVVGTVERPGGCLIGVDGNAGTVAAAQAMIDAHAWCRPCGPAQSGQFPSLLASRGRAALVNDQALSPPRDRMPCLNSSIANLAAASSGMAAVVTFGLLEAIHLSSNEVRTLPTGNLRSK